MSLTYKQKINNKLAQKELDELIYLDKIDEINLKPILIKLINVLIILMI